MFQLSLNEKLRLIALQWSTSNSEADDYSENVDGLEIVFFFFIAAQMEKNSEPRGIILDEALPKTKNHNFVIT